MNQSGTSAPFIGGLFGELAGGTAGEEVRVLNSDYSGGVIKVVADEGQIYAGGLAGNLMFYAYLEGCSTAAAEILLEKSGPGIMYIGGYAGQMRTGIRATECFSTSPLRGDNGTGATGSLYAGGFCASLYGSPGSAIVLVLDGCYATCPAAVSGYGAMYIGGLAGQSLGSSTTKWNTISQCYATGDVSAVSLGDTTTYAFCVGGLIGEARMNAISDCYALGNVFADKQSGTGAPYVGGLVGYFGTSGSLERCFAAGTVTAQSNVTDPLIAGGLVGQSLVIGFASNNAALGASVTATGPITKSLGRVLTTTGSNNYANSWMLVRTSDTYDAYPSTGGTIISTDDTSKEGKDLGPGTQRSRSFWETTLGFSTDEWDFGTVVGRGHPVLKGLSGQ
jgi:hypothetical protein